MSEEKLDGQPAADGKVVDTSTYKVHVYCDEYTDYTPSLHCTLYKDMPDGIEYDLDGSKRDPYKVMETTLDYYSLDPVGEGSADMMAYLVARGFDRDAVRYAVARGDDDWTWIVHGRHDVREYAVPVVPSKFVEWASRARRVGGLELEDVETGELFLPQCWLEKTGVPPSDIGWTTRGGELLEAGKISGSKSITMMVSTVADRVNRIDIEFADGSARSFHPYCVSYNSLGYGSYGMYDCEFPCHPASDDEDGEG